MDSFLSGLAGYNPPPPGPQLFPPPPPNPRRASKPKAQSRTNPRAADAGPLPSIGDLIRRVAQEPVAPPTAEEALRALGGKAPPEGTVPPPPAEPSAGPVRPPLKKQKREAKAAFPAKLHEMVSRHPDVIRWERGRLVIADPQRLCAELMLRYFTVATETAQFSSFNRQLNYYGFVRTKTADMAYANPQVSCLADLATLVRKETDEPARKQPRAPPLLTGGEFAKPRGRVPLNEEGAPAAWDSKSGAWVGVDKDAEDAAAARVSAADHRRVVEERDALREEVSKLKKALKRAEALLPPPTTSAEAVVRGDRPDPRVPLADSATRKDLCAFCGKHHGTPNADGTLEGDLLFPPFSGDGGPVWVHAQCALYSAEVHGEREGDLYNVLDAVKRGRKMRCSACGERGATVGCGNARCQKSFHLKCAAAHGLLGGEGEASFMCMKHMVVDGSVQCDRCFKWRSWKKVDPGTGRPYPMPEGDWFCELNEDKSCASCFVKAEIGLATPEAQDPDVLGDVCEIADQTCAFCGSVGCSSLESGALGGLVTRPLKDGAKDAFYHAACLMLAPEVRRSGGHVFKGLSALRRGRNLKCFGCKKRGATVGCGVAECPRSFHAPCALFRSGGCVDAGDGESAPVFYCAAHRARGTDRWVGCSLCGAWRRWAGPVDATGEPLLASDAEPTCADLGSSCDAPADEVGAGEVELTEAVPGPPPARPAHPLLGGG